MLTDAFRRNVDARGVQRDAARLLGEHLGAARVHYADVISDGEVGVVEEVFDTTGGPSLIGRHRLDDYGAAVFADIRAGRTVTVDDVGTDPRLTPDQRAATGALGIGAYVITPLLRNRRLDAMLVVHHDQARAWTLHEIELVEECADRTRAAVEWARAEVELRESEARFRLLADALPLPLWVHGPDGTQEWVNQSFCDFFGVDRDDMRAERWVVLTHPDDDHYRNAFEHAVANRTVFDAEVRVRRGDGEWRTLHSWARPRFDITGTYLGHVGVSADITERKAVEAAERRSRVHAELLATIIASLEKTTATTQLQLLVDAMVPDFADFATIEQPTASEPLLAFAHHDPGLAVVLHELRRHHRLPNQHPFSVAYALSADGTYDVTIDDETITEHVPDPRTADLLRRLNPTSYIAVPIDLGDNQRGVLTTGTSGNGRAPLTGADIAALTDIVNHAGLVMAQTRLREEEHRISLRLQQALLPAHLASTSNVDVAARYEAASDVLEVGGDWYDSLLLPDGRLLLVAGDVVGHGLEAAAMMGRLRAGLAALAVEHTSPARLLCLLDAYASSPGGGDYTTAFCVVIDPTTGHVDYASAGHPPALIVTPDGQRIWLDAATTPPLCTSSPTTRSEASMRLPPGSRLVLYTDGLVERRHETLDTGLDRLATATVNHRHAPPDELCRTLISMARQSVTDDDTVVLCAPYDEPGRAPDPWMRSE